MCLDILRNPTKAIMAAKNKRNANRTLLALLESSVLFAVSAGILVAKTGFPMLAATVIATFFMALVAVLLFGLVLYISTTTLGGRGRYLEGLTVAAYSMVPVSAGFFVLSLLAWVPFTIGVQIIVLALTLALGISMLYRGVKELYRVDMITSLVSISIAFLSVLLAIYVSAGLSLLSRLATGVF